VYISHVEQVSLRHTRAILIIIGYPLRLINENNTLPISIISILINATFSQHVINVGYCYVCGLRTRESLSTVHAYIRAYLSHELVTREALKHWGLMYIL
jgi:hypothetical protein